MKQSAAPTYAPPTVNTFIKPRTRTKFAIRAFFCWTSSLESAVLLAELRSINSKDTFKRRLKTKYFELAFLHYLAHDTSLFSFKSYCAIVRPNLLGVRGHCMQAHLNR